MEMMDIDDESVDSDKDKSFSDKEEVLFFVVSFSIEVVSCGEERDMRIFRFQNLEIGRFKGN
ncbi:hypothetical protein TanjilG_08072 [Lupinus angustifolius]|uniref:Uncharacterized protein n=1 Tax=Lupinus angustifolius TaxID=3871 RepID=A0A1J7IRA4_LUPAN|nr:hypothetical protein TanjilG_08072 [Lupinus angustifolius]